MGRRGGPLEAGPDVGLETTEGPLYVYHDPGAARKTRTSGAPTVKVGWIRAGGPGRLDETGAAEPQGPVLCPGVGTTCE